MQPFCLHFKFTLQKYDFLQQVETESCFALFCKNNFVLTKKLVILHPKIYFMTFALLIFGLASHTLLSVIIGLFGARRRIGFGWTFLLSVLLTPIAGIIGVLVSDPLPGQEKKWGCIGILLASVVIIALLLIGLVLVGAFMA